MENTRKAIIKFQDGDTVETTAKLDKGKWLIGGDYPESGNIYLIEFEKNGRPAWGKLQGNRLIFQDYI